jgi:predicted transcriptional regulator of viral defense system
MDHNDGLVCRVAEAHHGIFSQRHLTELGVSRHVRKHRIASGRWAVVHENVYRLVGMPLTWRGRVLAACWAGGPTAVASYSTAAELWEIPGRSTAPIEITCPRWRRTQQQGLLVHESGALKPVDWSLVDGIPVTTAARTIFDLARRPGHRTIDLAIGTALRREVTTVSELTATLDRLARRGRAGTLKFREALERHTSDDALTESEAEHALLRLFANHGLPQPVPQYEIRDRDGRLVARADFAYPDLKIAIEYDSYAHHVGKEALVRDSGRRNAVVALGWLPITATANDLRSGGHRLAIDVHRARSLRTGVNSAE